MTITISTENHTTHESHPERDTYRVELTPEFCLEPRQRKQSAFLFGRLSNELRFVLQTSWLCSTDDNHRIELLVQGCESTAMALSEDSTYRHQVATIIQDLRDRLVAELSSEYRSDVLHELSTRYSLEDECSFNIEDEFNSLAKLVRGLELLLQPLLSTVQRQCECDLRHGITNANCIGLGTKIDQGIHPPFNRTAINLHIETDNHVRPSWINSPLENDPIGWCPQISVNSDWLNSVWLEHAKTLMNRQEVWVTNEAATLPAIFYLVNEYFQLEGSPPTLHHQLWFHSATRTVTNSASDVPLPLRRQSFELLHHFNGTGGEPTTLDWLMQNWVQFGRGTAKTRATVDTAISVLNGEIECWGLEVASSSGNGWVLGCIAGT